MGEMSLMRMMMMKVGYREFEEVLVVARIQAQMSHFVFFPFSP